MHLVLLETAGNQHYIFATNKLADNMGASELIRRAGSDFVIQAVRDAGGPDLSPEPDLRGAILDVRKNSPCELSSGIEIVLATSGKAMVLTATPEAARAVVQGATQRALEHAPGVDLCGVVCDFNWSSRPIHEVIQEAHAAIDQVRASRPGPDLRFQRLPIVTDCPSSGLPAESISGEVALSRVSRAKREAIRHASKRMAATTLRNGLEVDFLGSIDRLETQGGDDANWLGVVHADGNGLGEIFLAFDQRSHTEGAAKNREYVNTLREFSIALEVATEAAFTDAVKAIAGTRGDRSSADIVPLVLGGDDLTVAVKGTLALKFAKDFLDAFEVRTGQSEAGVLARVAGTRRLSACAGVAIVKAHFPFFSAYHLAEQLLQSAKTVKGEIRRDEKAWPCSALDFHVLYDSSGADLDVIRSKMKLPEVDGLTLLYARPYVVTPEERLDPVNDVAWLQPRRWGTLLRRATALGAREGDRRKLPNSQMHDLRASLFLGHAEADARLELIFERYRDEGLADVVHEVSGPTFFEASGDERVTGFLDALEAMPFLGKEN